MPTLKNARQHDLTAAGVKLAPGLNEVSDAQYLALQADPQFQLWSGLKPTASGEFLRWVGLVAFSPEQHQAQKAAAKAAAEAAEAAREAAAAQTASSEEAVSASQRAAQFAEETAAAQAREAAAKAAAAESKPDASGKGKK